MFSSAPDSKSKLNSQSEMLMRKRKREEQELNDRAIAEALEANVEAFDKKPADNLSLHNQLSNEGPNTNTRGMRITPVPEWHANMPAPADTSDQSTVPSEIRGITLGYLDSDIVSETKKYLSARTSHKKFIFFNQTDLPVTAFLKHVVHGDLKE